MKSILAIIKLLEKSISDEPSDSLYSGNIIKSGYSHEVDEYRGLVNNSKDWLTSYQEEVIATTNISSIKIKYTGASGYFIELPKSQAQKVPADFILKQTLVNTLRYNTADLQNFSQKIEESEQKLSDSEYKLFLQIRESVLEGFNEIKILARSSAHLDFIGSLASAAYKYNYTKPEITKEYALSILSGRHPVIESIEPDFVSNDVEMSRKNYVHTISGPNMGGKSTFLRQNALIILMSHIGGFVPSRKAKIPLTDKIFSRVGANDNLFLGQSTFMVEMQEVANILHNSTSKSFVIIDEVGRGTSTFDGMSLAWAILKYNHDIIKAKTLFATHYHELIDESESLIGVQNFSVAVGENEDSIVFLRKIIPGALKKSYGIHVAKLAGLGNDVLSIAQDMLQRLEMVHPEQKQISFPFYEKNNDDCEKEGEFYLKIKEKMAKIDIENLTPLESINTLYKIKKDIESM